MSLQQDNTMFGLAGEHNSVRGHLDEKESCSFFPVFIITIFFKKESEREPHDINLASLIHIRDVRYVMQCKQTSVGAFPNFLHSSLFLLATATPPSSIVTAVKCVNDSML